MRRFLPLVLLFAAVLLVIWWQGTGPSSSGPERDDAVGRAPDTREVHPPAVVSEPSAPVPSVLLAEGSLTFKVHVVRGGAPAVARVEVFRSPTSGFRVMRRRDGEVPIRTLLATVVTNTRGHCEIRGLSRGRLLVVARAEDGAAACRDWGGSWGILRLELTDRNQVLLGRARYADGTPFRGRAEVEDGPGMVVNEDGTFRFRDLPAGRIGLRLIDPGRIAVTRWLDLPRDDEFLVIVDEGFLPIEGRVLAAEDDRPIADAEVVFSTRGKVLVRTDADGWFRAAAPNVEPLFARVAAKGYAPAGLRLSRGTGIEIRLLRRSVLKGRVVDPSGQPVAGVTVSASDHEYQWGPTSMAETGPDGTFILDGLSPGRVVVSARGGGWVSERETQNTSREVDPNVFRLRAGETRTIEIVVVGTGAIEGTVRGTDGSPRAGVTVTAKTPDEWGGSHAAEVTTTDSRGRYRFEAIIPGHPYEVHALPTAGASIREGPVTVESGGVATVDLAFLPERWVDLTVRMQAGGHPVAGAGVTVRFGRSEMHFQTTAEGTARLGPLPGSGVTLRVDHGDCLCSRVPVSVPEGQDHLLIEMPPALFIAGRATENGGRPAEGVRVVVASAEHDLDDYELETTVFVAGNGSFRIGPLPRGAHEISFSGGEGQSGERLRMRVEAGTEDLLLELPPATEEPEAEREEEPDLGVMTVRWVGPDGRPAMGGQADYRHDARQRPLWVVQRNPGEFRYQIKALGVSVRFEVSGATNGKGEPLGAARSASVRTAPGEILIRLPAAGHIEGRVLDEKGRGARGFTVFARRVPDGRESSRLWHGSCPTAEEGVFRIDGLGDFLYHLEVNTPPDYVRPEPLALKPGAADVEIRLRRGAGITVKVLTPDGKPHGARVIAVRRPDRTRIDHAWSGETGIASFAGLDPDREYDLRIVDAGDGWAWNAERIRPGGDPVVARLGPGLTIQGRFEVPNGAERFEVYIDGEGASVWGEVDAAGTFTIRGLTPGRWKVRLFAGGVDGKQWAGSADVEAGKEVAIKLSE